MWKWISQIALMMMGLSSAAYAAFDDCPPVYFLSIQLPAVSNCERQHLMTVGGGVSSPSVAATFGENPAGFIYNTHAKAMASTVSLSKDSNAPSLFSVAGGIGTGNIGGGLGFHQLTETYDPQTGVLNRATMVSAGFAGDLRGLGIAPGLKVSRVNTGNFNLLGMRNIPKTSFDYGFLVNPKGKFRMGAMLLNITGSGYSSVLGLGSTLFLGNHWALGVDGTSRRNGTGKVVRSSIGFSGYRFQFTLGYGQDLDDHQDAWIPSELTFGMGLWIKHGFRAVMYFNRLERSYLGITIKF